MSEARLFPWLVAAWTLLAIPTFLLLLRVSAPYGRHARGGWGPRIPARIGWIVMEAPSPLVMAVLFVVGRNGDDPAARVFLALWLGHYVYRAFVFPFLGRGAKAPMPISIALSAFGFNLVNAYVNGRWLFELAPRYGGTWLSDPRFLAGLALFLSGFAIHLRADSVLRGLRKPGETGYRVPRGFLFERVSSPNYLGEIVEWAGWALLTWSLAGLSFAVWTAANLVPRAIAHHRWYRERFPDYPAERKAVVPGLL